MPGATLDQVFVWLKHSLLGYTPSAVQPAFSVLLTIIPILLVFPVLFALTTVLERKGLGRIQNRYGPNRVGIYGVLQPMADALKSLTKEDIVPPVSVPPRSLSSPALLFGSGLPAVCGSAHRPEHDRRQP